MQDRRRNFEPPSNVLRPGPNITKHLLARHEGQDQDVALLDVPCMNCQELIPIDDIDRHSEICTNVSETVFRIENNVTLKELDFKLEKIRGALSSHLTKVNRDLKYAGERDSKILKIDSEICEKAVEYVGKILAFDERVEARQLRYLRNIIEEVQLLVVRYAGSPQIIIYLERVKNLGKEKYKELMELDHQKLSALQSQLMQEPVLSKSSVQAQRNTSNLNQRYTQVAPEFKDDNTTVGTSIRSQNLYPENSRNTISANSLVSINPSDPKQAQSSSDKAPYYSNNLYQPKYGNTQNGGYQQYSPQQQQQVQFQPYQTGLPHPTQQQQNTKQPSYQSQQQTYYQQQSQQPHQSQQKPYQPQTSQIKSNQNLTITPEISSPTQRKTPTGANSSNVIPSNVYGTTNQKEFGTTTINMSTNKPQYQPYSYDKTNQVIRTIPTQTDQRLSDLDNSKEKRIDPSRSKNPKNVVVIVEKEDADAEDEIRLQEKLENKKKELENLDKLLTTFKQKTDQLQSSNLLGQAHSQNQSGSTNILSPSFKATSSTYLSSNPRSYASPPSLRQSANSELTKQNVDQFRNDGSELTLENAKIIYHKNYLLDEVSSEVDKKSQASNDQHSESAETDSNIGSVYKNPVENFKDIEDLIHKQGKDIEDDKFKEMQRLFYSKCLAHKMKLSERDLAHLIPVAILFQKAQIEKVPEQEWDKFILEAFLKPDAYIDPKKLKKKREKGFKNRLAEKARQQQAIAKKKQQYESKIEIIHE